MKVATSALLVGAATAINFQQDTQQVLGGVADKAKDVFNDAKEAAASWTDKVKEYEAAFGEMTSEAKALFDEIAMLAPEAMNSIPPLIKPAKYARRPDSHWDFITKGAHVQSLWTEATAEEESRRVVGGDLEDYNLRTKAVDPSKLGVDTVKQYSGYLDDEANDKHLFYCKLAHAPPRPCSPSNTPTPPCNN